MKAEHWKVVVGVEQAQPRDQEAGALSRRDSRTAFERLLLVVTFTLVFIMAARTPLDTDMWWHLRAGEETLRTGRILLTDLFSFTRTGAPWTNAFWLSQVTMALVFRWGGFLALGGWVALLATLSMAFVYGQCEGPPFLKSAALLLGSVVASVVWSPRPQLVSLVLMALVGYLLYLYKRRDQDRLWFLPLIFVLWGNSHGGYPLGLILIGAMIAGEALNGLIQNPAERALPAPKILRLILVGILCGLAVLINPNGLGMWKLPFQTVDMRVLQQYIPEWASPDFHDLLQQSMLWLLLAVVAAMALSGRPVDGSDLVTILVFAYMALVARRNFGPFALVAVPVLVRYGAAALQSWQGRSAWLSRLLARNRSKESAALQGSPRGVRLLKKVVNLAIAALLFTAAVLKLYGVTHPALAGHYLAHGYPVEAVRWLADNRPAQNVLNEYAWGGYMQWSLRGFPIFVDGRTDLYGDEIIGDWIELVQAGADWQPLLDHYAVDLVMLQPDRPLLAALSQAGWQRLYGDSQAVIYGRP